MFGIKFDGGIMTDPSLDAVIAFKKEVVAHGKKCTLVQSKSTLEALLKQLEEE